MSRFNVRFRLTEQAKAYEEKVKILPYVTYVADYIYKGRRMVMVTIDGELTEERKQKLNSLK